MLEKLYLNAHAVPVLIVATLLASVGIFIFKKNSRALSNISFFVICIMTSIWLCGMALIYCLRDAVLAKIWYRSFAFFGVSQIAPSIYFFSVSWLRTTKENERFVIAGYILSGMFYLAAIGTPWMITGIRQYHWGFYPIYGPLAVAFLAYFALFYLASLRNFVRGYQKTQTPMERSQFRLIFTAFFITFIASVDYLPKLFHFPLYPFGYLMVAVWLPIVAYSIIRYQLMDIQTAIHKTIMWISTSLILGAPVVIFFYFARSWLLQLQPFVFVMVIAGVFVLFAIYSRYIQPQIDHLFQRRQWDLNRALERFTDELVHLRDLEQVIHHIINTVKTIFYLPNVSLLVRIQGSDVFEICQAIRGKSEKPYDMEDRFMQWLEANDVVVVGEYVSIDPRLHDIVEDAKRYFQSLGAKVCVPMVINQKLIGVLNIGQKQNFQPFRAGEIVFLSDLRRSAAIALSNSLHIIAMQENLRRWSEELEKKVAERTKQLQETQAQLVQAEKLATIGTLAGGVAHEINNPMTAVLTNAQILKMTANPEDLESIVLIEEGAKRCQTIIQNLLKYARKSGPEGPQGEVDLPQVMRNVISLLSYQFKQENTELVLDLRKVPLIEGISNEMEQVLTNLLINARDAIRKAGRPGRIEVTMCEREKEVEIRVSDNGTGIPREAARKIFDPFFTTKEVGKGTGLGLAVSYSIIQKFGGRITFESQQNLGSTFILHFPVIPVRQSTSGKENSGQDRLMA